jgi:hypothetical protein
MITSPDDRLAQLLGELADPARPAVDEPFVARVMDRVARRELALQTAGAVALVAALGVLVCICAHLSLRGRGLAPAAPAPPRP